MSAATLQGDSAAGIGAAVQPFVRRDGLIRVYDMVGCAYLGMLSGALRARLASGKVRGYFLVFVPTVREMRDFYREM
eukprot:SAG31_NODE_187_length_20848_cov_22.521953_12_plen_77_part_00